MIFFAYFVMKRKCIQATMNVFFNSTPSCHGKQVKTFSCRLWKHGINLERALIPRQFLLVQKMTPFFAFRQLFQTFFGMLIPFKVPSTKRNVYQKVMKKPRQLTETFRYRCTWKVLAFPLHYIFHSSYFSPNKFQSGIQASSLRFLTMKKYRKSLQARLHSLCTFCI